VFVVLVVVQRRGSELFVLSVRDGRVLVVRGAVPIRLLNEVGDVVRAGEPVRRGTVRATIDGRKRTDLEITGMDDSRDQRLRNVFFTFPAARLLAASPSPERNLGQRLGIASLAWLLHDR
jgi:hypothetical protein